ncbi:hypothetical protein CEXT_761031 [Caerostris extrusa]|uniref:Uncharacterized protein n=1 Tax=Caerostris extrusa TaxID=172846 RepID=A0AAV4XRF0_CAEEX|nr:hypothetical protein CEXT_761031 [Caerostris extrusa]
MEPRGSDTNIKQLLHETGWKRIYVRLCYDGTLKQQQIDGTYVKIVSTGERCSNKWMKQRRRRTAQMLSRSNNSQSI